MVVAYRPYVQRRVGVCGEAHLRRRREAAREHEEEACSGNGKPVTTYGGWRVREAQGRGGEKVGAWVGG